MAQAVRSFGQVGHIRTEIFDIYYPEPLADQGRRSQASPTPFWPTWTDFSASIHQPEEFPCCFLIGKST